MTESPNIKARRILILALCLTVLFGCLIMVMDETSRAVDCSYNLRRIYQALDLYEMHNGALPELAFYPDEPLSDPSSIRVVLETYGPEEKTWTCPGAHKSIRETGLSYIWNTALGGTSLRSAAEKTWMLVELNGLSREVGRPHSGFCNVLFTDGSVERIRFPIDQLAGLRQ